MMMTKILDALRRVAAGKRVNKAMMDYLMDLEYIAYDEYGSLVLTKQGSHMLNHPHHA